MQNCKKGDPYEKKRKNKKAISQCLKRLNGAQAIRKDIHPGSHGESTIESTDVLLSL